MTVEFRLGSTSGQLLSGGDATISSTPLPDVGPFSAYDIYWKNQVGYTIQAIIAPSGYEFSKSVYAYFEYNGERYDPYDGNLPYAYETGSWGQITKFGDYDYYYRGTYSRSRTVTKVVIICRSSGYRITTVSSPAIGGTTSGDGVYSAGSFCTINATPNPGYGFSNWTSLKGHSSTVREVHFQVNYDDEWTAHFVLSTGEILCDSNTGIILCKYGSQEILCQ